MYINIPNHVLCAYFKYVSMHTYIYTLIHNFFIYVYIDTYAFICKCMCECVCVCVCRRPVLFKLFHL